MEAQYNLAAGRPDYAQTVMPDWLARSAAARDGLGGNMDVRYGEGARCLLDVFGCGDPSAPVLIYLHGGYWQRGEKAMYSFLAPPFLAAGVNVVIVGYDLCPAVSVTQISAQIREALAFLWHEGAALGLNRDRLVLAGHSAGGHLTEMMLGTDWPGVDDALPAGLIRAGVVISPLSVLEPLRYTSINDALGMDAAEAAAQSPLLNHPPRTDAPQLVAVGGLETDEFHRQARIYAEALRTAARPIELYTVPEVDHLDEINALADADSAFFAKVMALLRAT